MKNRILTLAVGVVLIVPSLAVAAYADDTANMGEVTPADMRDTSAPITLQSKVEGPSGELLATQPGEVEISEVDVQNQANSIDNTANMSDVTPADMRTTPAPITLQSKVKGPSGELLATQPGEVEVSEVRRYVVR